MDIVKPCSALPEICGTCARSKIATYGEHIYPWCRRCFRYTKVTDSVDLYTHLNTYPEDYEVYIAGPFFNQSQLDVIDGIMRKLDELGVSYFSPYYEGGLVKELDRDSSEAIFILDYMGIVHCKWVLSILTYEDSPTYIRTPDGEYREIKLSDTGTVWEMGAGFAMRKPVVGFFPEGSRPGKMNLMLTECLDAVVEGVDELEGLIKANDPAKRWEGKVQ